MQSTDKTVLALTLFADNLRGKGQHDIADEIDAIAENYANKERAPKKKKP